MGVWKNGAWMYEGMVLAAYTRSEGYDGDYNDVTYAHVWNPETKKSFTVVAHFVGGAKEDASPELKAEVAARYRAEEEAKEAARVDRGKKVRVVRGRKVPKGTEGTVIWMGSSRYGYKVTKRIGLKDQAGTVHWTAEANVEVVAA
jgi:hypothetical protein